MPVLRSQVRVVEATPVWKERGVNPSRLVILKHLKAEGSHAPKYSVHMQVTESPYLSEHPTHLELYHGSYHDTLEGAEEGLKEKMKLYREFKTSKKSHVRSWDKTAEFPVRRKSVKR